MAFNIRIGLIAPITGDVQSFGESMRKGSLLALEERQYKAGDFKIACVITDDRNDATGAVNMAQKLISRDKVNEGKSTRGRLTCPLLLSFIIQ